jgi:hypothetical protein
VGLRRIRHNPAPALAQHGCVVKQIIPKFIDPREMLQKHVGVHPSGFVNKIDLAQAPKHGLRPIHSYPTQQNARGGKGHSGVMTQDQEHRQFDPGEHMNEPTESQVIGFHLCGLGGPVIRDSDVASGAAHG